MAISQKDEKIQSNERDKIMLNILIGHRGTGKSHFLDLIRVFYKKHNIPAGFFDLDQEIEKRAKKSLEELLKEGEDSFRKLEKKTFKNLVQSLSKNKIYFISVGAGFVFKKKPLWNVIYLCRYSDEVGRAFLRKPKLSPLAPFKEYKKLYEKRNIYYFKQADEQLLRREHFKQLETSDLLFLGLKKFSHDYFSLRLNPEDLPQNKNQTKAFLQKRLNWGLRFVELNDKTANESFIKTIREIIPEEKILFSSQNSRKFLKIKNKKNWSWDLDLGAPPKGVNILALHKRGKKSLKTLLKEFAAYKNYHLKLAVEIFNLKELRQAYDWYRADPENRSFLPRSKTGRWLWFRQAFGPKMFLHFIKERAMYWTQIRKNEILDQPFLSQALPFVKKPPGTKLAGILADPTWLSATPKEQNHFFYKQRTIPVLALPWPEKEMTKQNLKILSQLGFIFFAISSPLKSRAFLVADLHDKISKNFKTANTLIFDKPSWRAFNTDWNGLQELKKYSSPQTVIWGGGGIRPILKKVLPLAGFYSARTGKLLKDKKQEDTQKKKNKRSTKHLNKIQPKTLIWAVGRDRMEKACLWPPRYWSPSQVIDINYTEDSPGLEYALLVKAKYKKGWRIFKTQAKKQRDIFLKTTNL